MHICLCFTVLFFLNVCCITVTHVLLHVVRSEFWAWGSQVPAVVAFCMLRLPVHSHCLLISWLFILWFEPIVDVSVSPNPVPCLDPTAVPSCINVHAWVCFVLVPLLTCFQSLITGICPLPFSSEAYNILWKNKRVQVRKMTFSI